MPSNDPTPFVKSNQPEGLTYACPAPDCTWTITDRKADQDSLGTVAMIKWNERFGIKAKDTRYELQRQHDAKLLKIITEHLRTHPGLEQDPEVETAAQYTITMTRLRFAGLLPTKETGEGS